MFERILHYRKELSVLLAVIIVHFVFSFSFLSQPMLDGRLHVFNKTAKTLSLVQVASDPIIKSPLKHLALSSYEYDAAGKVVGLKNERIAPVLPYMVISKLMGVLGGSEFVLRSLLFLFSMLILSFLYLFFLSTSKSFFESSFLLFLFSFLPVHFLYVIHWNEFIFVAISLLLSVFSLFKLQEKDANKTVFKSLFYVSLVAGTLSSFVFFVPFLVILSFLYLKRESSVFKQYWIGATLAFIATFLIQLVLLSSLGFSFSDLLHKLSQWQSLGSDISIYEFLFRQFYFLDYNFTFINAFFGFGLISFLILTKTYFKNSLLFAGSCFLSLGLVSVLFFPGLSYYDPAYQMGFGLAYICLLGGFLINMKKRIWVGPHVKIFTFSLLIPLVVVTLFSALGLRYNIYSAQFAKADDISYLSSVSKRIIYFRSEISGPVEWWESPVVSYYTSRFYRGDRVQLGVVPYSKSLRLNRSSDRLVLSKSVPQSIRYQLLSKVLSPNVPVVSKTTSSFLFYTWKPPPPPKVEEVLISD